MSCTRSGKQAKPGLSHHRSQSHGSCMSSQPPIRTAIYSAFFMISPGTCKCSQKLTFNADSSITGSANRGAVCCKFERCEGKCLATNVCGALRTSRYLIPGFLPYRLRRHHAMGDLSLFHLRLDHTLLR